MYCPKYFKGITLLLLLLLLFYFLVVLARGRFEHFQHGLIQKLLRFPFFSLLQIFEGEERSLESISAASCVDRSKKK
jgi:hypothetical protein